MEKPDISCIEEIILSVSFHFSAAHAYYISELNKEKNKTLFGNYYSVTPHGHNYLMIISVRGNPNRKSGMVINFNELEDRINALVVVELDNKYLNTDVKYFKNNIPTTENIAIFVWNTLLNNLESFTLHSVRIYEHESLYVEIR